MPVSRGHHIHPPGSRIRRRRSRQRGQTILFIAMLLVVLLVICFFLFDLNQVIRLRMRTQNGADAAALTGAAWQGRSLNTIGELNLLKGAALILSEVPGSPRNDDNIVGLLDSVDLLTEMQTRVSYVGPLLGLAAAQQSAKNNGLRDVGAYTSWISRHRSAWIEPPNSVYGRIYGSDPLNIGYNWLSPYDDMLHDVVSRGVAAMPLNQRYLRGAPELDGVGGSLLLNREFYRAVHARDYCWFYHQGLTSDAPPIDMDNIQFSQNPLPWFPGSEYLPLYVTFQTVGGTVSNQIPNYVAARGWTPLPTDVPDYPSISWATFDTSDFNSWGDDSYYTDANQYMRNDFRPEYAYGGAAVVMQSATAPALITGAWRWQYGSEPPAQGETLGEAFEWSEHAMPGVNPRQGGGTTGDVVRDASISPTGDRTASFSRYARRVDAAESRLARLRQTESIHSRAAAKPFGSLGNNPVSAAGIVLPVFTEVRLIPLILVDSNLSDEDPAFYMFLINYFGDPRYPNVPQDIVDRYSYYLTAIAMYNDLTGNWRQGWRDAEAYWASTMDRDGDGEPDPGVRHPCNPILWSHGPGGGGSRGGPRWVH